MRRASVHRVTKETDILIHLNLDGQGRADVATGIRFLDHMLDLVARHGAMELKIFYKVDLDVD